LSNKLHSTLGETRQRFVIASSERARPSCIKHHVAFDVRAGKQTKASPRHRIASLHYTRCSRHGLLRACATGSSQAEAPQSPKRRWGATEPNTTLEGHIAQYDAGGAQSSKRRWGGTELNTTLGPQRRPYSSSRRLALRHGTWPPLSAPVGATPSGGGGRRVRDER
jgi:hypothetical protein